MKKSCLKHRLASLVSVILLVLCVVLYGGGCSSDSSESEDSSSNDGAAVTLTDVLISGTTEISATGSTTLTASPKFSGTADSSVSSSVTYKWELEDGASYVTLSSYQNKATVIGKNKTSDSQTAKIKVTATYNGTSKSKTQEISIKAKTSSDGSSENQSDEKVTVTFLDSEKTVRKVTFTKGGSPSSSSVPEMTKAGYNFLGWALSENSTTFVESGTTFNEDTNLYAVWEIITYTIIYNLGDGVSWASGYEPVSTFTVEDEITLPQPENLVNSDSSKIFKAWRNNYNYEEISAISKGTTGNKSFTALWSSPLYTISYEGIEDTELLNYTLRQAFTEDDTTIVLPTKNQITKTGYELKCWRNKDNSYLTIEYLTSKTKISSSKTLTLIAYWNPKTYKITYEENGATTSLSNPVSTYNIEDETITLPTDISKSGYTFGGWYESSDFEGDAATEIPGGSYGDKTFYAKWIPGTATYTVQHFLQRADLKGYTIDSSSTEIKTGATESIATAEPKTYKGFTAKNTPEKEIKGDGTTLLDIYYDRNTVSITLNANGGSFRSNSSETLKISGIYGTSIDEGYEEPVKDGYAFKEWSPEISDYTFPVEDTSYEAVWTENRISAITVSAPEYQSEKTGFLSYEIDKSSNKITFTATEGETYKWYVYVGGNSDSSSKITPRSTNKSISFNFSENYYCTVMLVIDDKYSATIQIKI